MKSRKAVQQSVHRKEAKIKESKDEKAKATKWPDFLCRHEDVTAGNFSGSSGQLSSAGNGQAYTWPTFQPDGKDSKAMGIFSSIEIGHILKSITRGKMQQTGPSVEPANCNGICKEKDHHLVERVKKMCLKMLPCGHFCTDYKEDGIDPCTRCREIIFLIRPCGHETITMCSSGQPQTDCVLQCGRKLGCGHDCKCYCGSKCVCINVACLRFVRDNGRAPLAGDIVEVPQVTKPKVDDDDDDECWD